MSRHLRTAVGLLLVTTMLQLSVGGTPSAAVDGPLHSVVVTGDGGVGAQLSTYPAFDPAIDRYAVRPGDSTPGQLTITASTTDPGGVITVDGRPVVTGSAVDVTGLEVGDEVGVSITDAAGTSHQSFIYLPRGFPVLTAAGSRPSDSPPYVFLGLGSFLSTTSFETVVDEHGVPIHVREALEPHDFKAQAHGPAYTVFEPVKEGPDDKEYGYRVRELDARFEETGTRRLTPVPELGVTPDDTDFHDVLYLADGRVAMVGYHRAVHADGRTWLDAVIEIVAADGTVEFAWTSKDHVSPSEAYVLGAKQEDYAHINSVEMVADGDLLASFRNLGQVMRIATTAHDGHQPGDVIWRMGGERNDFTFVNDPYAGFCAQHDARLLPNGHLMIFDNGSRSDGANALGGQTADMCPDPSDPAGARIARPQSRVLEYALDEAASDGDGLSATLVWDHLVPGRYAAFAGNAQRLPNGSTLVGWSNSQNTEGPAPAPFVSEVGADRDELWSLTAQGWFTYRAFTHDAPDAIAPEIEISGLSDGASYPSGSSQVVDFTCTDRGGSNLRTCTGTVPSGSAFTTDGTSFTVTATDGAGNTTTRTVRYGTFHGDPAYTANLSIRKPGGHWHGARRIGGSADQRIGHTLRNAGDTATAYVRVSNRHAPYAVPLRGRKGNEAFAVRYFHRGKEITARMVSGRMTTPELDTGESWTLRIELRRTRHAAPGDHRTIRVLARGRALGRSDEVAATVRAR